MTPHQCPVCNGRGEVPQAFYETTPSTGGPMLVSCRSCINGLVWEPSPLLGCVAPSPFYPAHPAYRGPSIVDPPAIGSPEYLKLEAQD